jgi:hypothetical protein
MDAQGVPVEDLWAWMNALARWLRDEGFCSGVCGENVSEVERTFATIDHPRAESVNKARAVRDALAWLWFYVRPAASKSPNPYVQPLAFGGVEAPSPEQELATDARAAFAKLEALRKRVNQVAQIRDERAQPIGGDPGMYILSAYDNALDAYETFVAAIHPVWEESGVLGMRVPYSLEEWRERCIQLEVALKVAGFADAELDALVPAATGQQSLTQRRYRQRLHLSKQARDDGWKAVRKELIGVLSSLKRERVLSFLRPPARLSSLKPSERDAAVKELQGLGLSACAAMVQDGARVTTSGPRRPRRGTGGSAKRTGNDGT